MPRAPRAHHAHHAQAEGILKYNHNELGPRTASRESLNDSSRVELLVRRQTLFPLWLATKTAYVTGECEVAHLKSFQHLQLMFPSFPFALSHGVVLGSCSRASAPAHLVRSIQCLAYNPVTQQAPETDMGRRWGGDGPAAVASLE